MTNHSYENLQKSILNASEQVPLGSKCFHYKDINTIYTIKDYVIIENSDEIGLVYESDESFGVKFVRPLTEFFDEVEFEGKTTVRFTFI